MIQGEEVVGRNPLLPGDEGSERPGEGGDGVQQQVLADAERGPERRGLSCQGDAEVSPGNALHLKSKFNMLFNSCEAAFFILKKMQERNAFTLDIVFISTQSWSGKVRNVPINFFKMWTSRKHY